MALGWRVKATVEVEGPEEGPQVITAELPKTSKEHALFLQSLATRLIDDLNNKRLPAQQPPQPPRP